MYGTLTYVTEPFMYCLRVALEGLTLEEKQPLVTNICRCGSAIGRSDDGRGLLANSLEFEGHRVEGLGHVPERRHCRR